MERISGRHWKEIYILGFGNLASGLCFGGYS